MTSTSTLVRHSGGASGSKRRRAGRTRRHLRLRKKVVGTSQRPRLMVTRSARHMYAQLVDDSRGVTLASASTYKLDRDTGDSERGDKTAQARRVGALLAERAGAVGITRVVFDRGGNRYHGRIAALADAARAGGLEL